MEKIWDSIYFLLEEYQRNIFNQKKYKKLIKKKQNNYLQKIIRTLDSCKETKSKIVNIFENLKK